MAGEGVGCLGGEEDLALPRVSLDANGVGKLIVAKQKSKKHVICIHRVPAVIGRLLGSEEGGHVVGEGANDHIREFKQQLPVDKMVHGNVEPEAVEDAAGACTIRAEGDVKNTVAFIIIVRKDTDRGRVVISLGRMFLSVYNMLCLYYGRKKRSTVEHAKRA